MNGSGPRTPPPLALAYLRQSPATITGLALQAVLQLPERDHGHLQRQLESRGVPHDGLQPPAEFEVHQHVFRYRLFLVIFSGGVRLRTGVVLWDVTKERRL